MKKYEGVVMHNSQQPDNANKMIDGYFGQMLRAIKWFYPDLDDEAVKHAARELDEEVLKICYNRGAYNRLPLNLNPYDKITWGDCNRIAAYLMDSGFFHKSETEACG